MPSNWQPIIISARMAIVSILCFSCSVLITIIINTSLIHVIILSINQTIPNILLSFDGCIEQYVIIPINKFIHIVIMYNKLLIFFISYRINTDASMNIYPNRIVKPSNLASKIIQIYPKSLIFAHIAQS